MANNSTKQAVQGGVLLDALTRLLFNGLDGIFDAAAEYEKEMGVLKQINKIKVADKDGNDYTCIVKLAPVKDKDGVYYVEISCVDENGRTATQYKFDGIDQSALKLDKSNKKEFKKWIADVLADNGLEEIEIDEESEEEESEEKESKSDKMSKKDLNKERFGPFMFFNVDNEDETYKVFIEMQGIPEKEKFVISVESDPELRFQYHDEIAFDDNTPNIRSSIMKYFEKCGVEPESSDCERALVQLEHKFSDYVDNITTSSTIRVRLEKITADGHDDINLISVTSSTHTRKQALDIVAKIVASDEFVDEMPEGESEYEITEDEDDYNIEMM